MDLLSRAEFLLLATSSAAAASVSVAGSVFAFVFVFLLGELRGLRQFCPRGQI